MDYIKKNISDVASNYLPWSKENFETNILSNKEIIKIASILNSSYIDNHLIDLPKLVVVGTQSSGKSSLLNALIGMDILPVGKSMTTRTPLHLELIQSASESRLEFGTYVNYQWSLDRKVTLNLPEISIEQTTDIHREIEVQTSMKAGNGLNISNRPIYIKIYAPDLPNLCLIDLPGLTSVAITDRGQPKDIKEQIIQLVNEYIEPKNTIILGIIAARPDIEADMAMEIVKNADPNGDRTIGVLTKLDLMNEGTDISNYLENNLSADLKLKYGYFGIRNRSSNKISIPEAIVQEGQYFAGHPTYRSEKYRDKLGIPNLSQSLSNILIYNIKLCLPNVLSNINHQLDETNEELSQLGTSIPDDKEVRLTILNGFLNQYIKRYTQAIEQRGSTRQTGRLLKEEFENFRLDIGNLNPFEELADHYIVDILKGYDGIHMSFPYLPIEVLENCLKDPKSRPIFRLYEPAQHCTQGVVDRLNELNHELLEEQPFKKYPNLIKAIKTVVLSDIFVPRHQVTLQKVKELVEQEESYIWTDDPHFQEVLTGDFSRIIKDGEFDVGCFKIVLYEYYKTIVRNVRENIPKAIVYHFIKNSVDNLSSILYEKVLTENTTSLLEEFPEIEKRRRILEKNRGDLSEIKRLIETIF